MEFNEILNCNDFRLKSIFSAYCETFPENERRSEKQFENLFIQEKVSIFSILNNSQFIGYFIIWELNNFSFLEHFEISEKFRSQSFGSKVLKKITENNPKIILETEHENLNSNASKRIRFYQANGFHKISNSYIQPSYDQGKESLKLLLFANFEPCSLDRITANIYHVVYGKY
jgi:ribosomal protein S18 acetylase RimI-like enzyme